MEEKRTWKLPRSPCPCSLLVPLLAILVPYQGPSPARRVQPVRCFRPPVGLHLPAVFPIPSFYPPCPRKFKRKKLCLTGGSSIPFQVEKTHVNLLEPMAARALE
ncbi:hypothetical protein OUZ56_032206 [Daphnia magna]|uniref:Uncharacterized protein n=1 Tax=Daphnia magna TaxID=35525 RepID=A0ABQ9ZXI6_9CRUS|nr:hypothetical protein OUZ56_032206 [Daphnia magna]